MAERTFLDYAREYKAGTRKIDEIPPGIKKEVLRVVKDPEVDLSSYKKSTIKKTDRFIQPRIRSYSS